MDMRQTVLLLIGLLASGSGHKRPRCYPESELQAAALRKLQTHYPQPWEPAAGPAGPAAPSCPLQLYSQQPPPADYRRRSLSPWRYENVTMDEHFPSSVIQARCLCNGCIQFNRDGSAFQSLDYNSVTVTQSRVFLQRTLCQDGRTYRLTPVSVDVAVACTCVRALSTS